VPGDCCYPRTANDPRDEELYGQPRLREQIVLAEGNEYTKDAELKTVVGNLATCGCTLFVLPFLVPYPVPAVFAVYAYCSIRHLRPVVYTLVYCMVPLLSLA